MHLCLASLNNSMQEAFGLFSTQRVAPCSKLLLQEAFPGGCLLLLPGFLQALCPLCQLSPSLIRPCGLCMHPRLLGKCT